MMNHKVASQILAQCKGALSALQEEHQKSAIDNKIFIVVEKEDGELTSILKAFSNENLAKQFAEDKDQYSVVQIDLEFSVEE